MIFPATQGGNKISSVFPGSPCVAPLNHALRRTLRNPLCTLCTLWLASSGFSYHKHTTLSPAYHEAVK